MKKLFALLLVLLLGVTVLAVAGCGGDTKQAQEDIKTADNAYAAVQKDMTALAGTLTTTIGGAMSGNFSSVTPAAIQQAMDTINKILGALPKVSQDYQKVNSLNGVEGYQAYSDAMVKTITAQEEAAKAGKSFLDSLAPVAATGDQAQIAAFFQANNQQLMSLNTMYTGADKAYSDAQQIKKDKNLQE